MKWFLIGLLGIASISILRMALGTSKKSKYSNKSKGRYGKKGGYKNRKNQLQRFINRFRDREIPKEEAIDSPVENDQAQTEAQPQVQVQEKVSKPAFNGPKLYSYFKCILCDKVWKNGNSALAEGQKCNSCQINVLPWRQDEIKPWKKKKKAADSTHSIQTCLKCQELGRPCGQGQNKVSPNLLLGGLLNLKSET